MTNNDSWTARWVSDNLSHEKCISIQLVNSNCVEVTLENKMCVKVATMSCAAVGAAEFQRIYYSTDIEFILNIQKEAVYFKDALEMSIQRSFGFGSVGDLYAAMNSCEFRHYISKETSFIMKGLKQHAAVSSVERLNNRLFQISRINYNNITVLALNEYDLTAESVRDGIEKFGKPHVILTSNPHCVPSDEAINAARASGVKVYNWGGLLKKLNH